MRAYFYVLLTGSFYLAAPAQAQFNDSVHHHVVANATGLFNRTKDGLTSLYNNNLKYSLRKESLRLNAQGSWVYGQNPQKITNDDWNTTFDANLYKTFPHFFYWGLVNYTKSYSLKIINQFQGGIGVAYKLIDKPNMTLGISDGFLYEYSEIYTTENDFLQYRTIRNSLRLQFSYKYKDMWQVNGTYFYQPSLTYSNDYIITTNTMLSVKLWRFINFNTSLAYNVISRTGRENLIWTYGLSLSRFF